MLTCRNNDNGLEDLLGIFEDKNDLMDFLEEDYKDLIAKIKYKQISSTFENALRPEIKSELFYAFNQTLTDDKQFKQPNICQNEEISLFYSYYDKDFSKKQQSYLNSLREHLQQVFDTKFSLDEKLRFMSEVLELDDLGKDEPIKGIYGVEEFEGEIR